MNKKLGAGRDGTTPRSARRGGIARHTRRFVPRPGPCEGVISETPPTLVRIASEGGIDGSMTLRRLSKVTGCSVSMLSRVFNGRRRASLKVAIAISKATGLAVERVAEIIDENRQEQLATSTLVEVTDQPTVQ